MARMETAALSLALIALMLGAGCSQNTAGSAPYDMVHIGTTKLSLFGIPASYRNLHVRLEKELDMPVFFRTQPDGAAIGQLLSNGDIQFAILSAGEYAQVEKPGDLTLLASAVNSNDSTTLSAKLIAKAGTDIKQLSDCKGRRFAFGTRGDPLSDYAAQEALREAGVPPKELVKELLPPPFAFDGRLYRGGEVVQTLLGDLTVNAGVIDEIAYAAMPDSGGNFITGPSKDQFIVLGTTMPVPERILVAGPAADPKLVAAMKRFFLEEIPKDAEICQQMGVKGFAEPNAAAYDRVRSLVPKGKDTTPAA